MRKSLVAALCFGQWVLVGCGSPGAMPVGADEAGGESAAVSTQSSALVQGGTLGGIRRCGTHDVDASEQAAIDREVAATRSSRLSTARRSTIKVPVHVHIITTTDGQGDATDFVPAQIDVLNAAYARAGVKFNLASLEVVVNDAWFTANIDTQEEAAMKKALRRGDAHALNLYTGVNDGSLLGWATFPKSYQKHPKDDGVVLAFDSMPGGGLEFPFDPTQEPDGLIAYDRGDTATHEVGHWMGLFHTFEGGCAKNGDRIDDTPAEAEPQFFCVARDSCTGKKFPGFDPINNFMDYVDDDCMFEFTTDQEDRMRDQWETYRG
jgi:hypothetical protein